MAYHDREVRKCKYCDKPAKRNIYIRPDTGKPRNKGFCRTCGSDECVTAQYRDRGVNARKAWKVERVCHHCEQGYIATGPTQRFCADCGKTAKDRELLRRYNLTHAEVKQMMADTPLCPICEKRKPTVVDHCHTENYVRGVICQFCNSSLPLVEDKDALRRAQEYLDAPIQKRIPTPLPSRQRTRTGEEVG